MRMQNKQSSLIPEQVVFIAIICLVGYIDFCLEMTWKSHNIPIITLHLFGINLTRNIRHHCYHLLVFETQDYTCIDCSPIELEKCLAVKKTSCFDVYKKPA